MCVRERKRERERRERERERETSPSYRCVHRVSVKLLLDTGVCVCERERGEREREVGGERGRERVKEGERKSDSEREGGRENDREIVKLVSGTNIYINIIVSYIYIIIVVMHSSAHNPMFCDSAIHYMSVLTKVFISITICLDIF